MTRSDWLQQSFIRSRIKALIGTIGDGRRASAPAFGFGDTPVLLASSTAIIALALIGLRGAPASAPSVDYIAPVSVSMPAVVPATPSPTPTPPVVAARPPAQPAFVPVFARSPLSREEGIRVVLATARALIGRPYRYGASGPDAFDCSGFTSYVWRTAGLHLPHNSAAQYSSVPRVPLDELQPGDLVFSGSRGVGHVGLYVGDGQMIDAPETGRSVEMEPLRGNLIGAARPALLLEPTKPGQAS